MNISSFIRRSNMRIEQLRELALLFIIILIVLFFGSQIPRYFTGTTFERVGVHVSIIVVVAVGMTLVVLTRNIDLSVGSTVGLIAFVVGQQLSDHHDLSPVLAVLLAIGIGTLLGMINGLIVAFGKVPAIVTTLGTLAIYRGLLFAYANSRSIHTQNLPGWIIDLPRVKVLTIGDLNITFLVATAIVIVVIFQLALIYLPSARRLYAIGSDPETALTSGIPQRRPVFFAFTICGALAGLGGFMYLAQIGTITTVAAQGLELEVVAAVVLGGVSTLGGTGRVIGALLGAVLVGIIEQGLVRMQFNEFWKQAIEGLAILIAVVSDSALRTRLRISLSHNQAMPISTETEKAGPTL